MPPLRPDATKLQARTDNKRSPEAPTARLRGAAHTAATEAPSAVLADPLCSERGVAT